MQYYAFNKSLHVVSSFRCNVCSVVGLTKVDENEVKSVLATKTNVLKLKQCEGCFMIVYCGEEHQKIDWPNHKQFCKAASKISKLRKISHPLLLRGEILDVKDIEEAKFKLKSELKSMLKRPLSFCEEEITSYPRCCQLCYAFKVTAVCETCEAVFYCSKLHLEEDVNSHSKNCHLLKLFYSKFKMIVMPKCNVVEKFSDAVTDLRFSNIVCALEDFIKVKLPKDPTSSIDEFSLFDFCADFSYIGTLCFALSFLNMKNFDSDHFTVFILGSTIEHQYWFREIHIRFFFVHYPMIKILNLYFIGPDTKDEHPSNYVIPLNGVSHQVTVTHFVGPTEKVFQFNVRPSVAIAYNCCFSNYPFETLEKVKATKNEWTDGLVELILTYNLPIIFTSYTLLESEFDYHEALRVAQSFKPHPYSLERFFSIMTNPFRDLRPIRHWEFLNKEEIRYRNAYVQGVKPKIGN